MLNQEIKELKEKINIEIKCKLSNFLNILMK
jgi:hypothetical protein